MPRKKSYSLAHDLNYVGKSTINTKRDYRGRTALHFAAKNGHLSEVKRFLDTLGADVDARDKRDKQTPLHATAAENRGNNYYGMIKTLLDHGADPNAQDKEGRTPLYLLARHGYVKIIQLLLDHKADVHIKNNYGMLPLWEAINGGNLDVAQLLVDSGSHLLHELIKTADDNYLRLALRLLGQGLNVNSQSDVDGKTPLHCFCNRTDVRTYQLFLELKADVHRLDNNGETPLFGVVRVGNHEATQLLLKYRSNVNVVNNQGLTVLQVAAECNSVNSHMKVSELLLKKGADVNARDAQGRTALHHLARNACVNTLKLFLSHGADVSIQDAKGEVPLFEAVRSKNNSILQMLMGDVVPNINKACFNYGSTMLHRAALHCKLEVVKGLVKRGADVNAVNLEGRTPVLSMLMNHSEESFRDKLAYLLKYVDIGKGNLLLWCKTEDAWRLVLERLALLQELDVPMDSEIFDSMLGNDRYMEYYNACSEELVRLKSTKVFNSWLSLFNLLADSKRKLKNYAGNRDLLAHLKRSDLKNQFPIYQAAIWNNVNKAVKTRRAYDVSANVLSNTWPIFGPSHLVVRDVLDCLSCKDYVRFISKCLIVKL